MTALARIMKEEVERLTRQQVKKETDQLRQEQEALRKELAVVMQRLAAVEQGGGTAPAWTGVDSAPNYRFTSKSVRRLRKVLGISQQKLSELVGVTAQAVYLWERKSGSLRLRDKTRRILLELRSLDKAEVRRRLAVIDAQKAAQEVRT